LIKDITCDDGTIAISGRELHDFFEVGKDFSPISVKTPNGRHPRIEYVMIFDMTKEVAMIQRPDRGKKARQYFIEIDKQAHHDMTGLSPAIQAALATAQALAVQKRCINRVTTKINKIINIVSYVVYNGLDFYTT